MSERDQLEGALVLGSRSESKHGEWDLFDDAPFTVHPMGSVAYKLGLVAAGRADATWTVVSKNEWDVAAGVALVLAGGGVAHEPDGTPRTFNSRDPLLTGLVAHPKSLATDIKPVVARHRLAQAARASRLLKGLVEVRADRTKHSTDARELLTYLHGNDARASERCFGSEKSRIGLGYASDVGSGNTELVVFHTFEYP